MTREKDDLITPQWLMVARRTRMRFIGTLLVVLAILAILAWLGLPFLQSKAAEAGVRPPEGHVKLILWLGGWFRYAWLFIALGGGAAIVLSLTGKIDSLLPMLTGTLLVVGLAAVAFTIYVFFLPALALIRQAS